MTVSTEVARNDYIGSGATDTFDYDFQIYDETDLLVTTAVSATGVETTLSYPTDYSVTGVGEVAGGTIVLTAGNLAVGSILSVRFRTTLTQETDLRNQGGYHSEDVEDMGDRLVKIDQQQQDEIDRSLKLGETVSGVSGTIENAIAGAYFRVNLAGDAIEAVATVADPGSVIIGTVSRSVTAKLFERVSWKDYGAEGDGIVANEAADITEAYEENPGADVFGPRGEYRLTDPLIMGGDGSSEFIYHSLVGEGWPNFIGAAGVTPTTLYFTAGSGVALNNAYQNIEKIAIRGSKAGGSDPTTQTFGNVGLSLSGGSYDGGSSNIEKVTVYSFDTGIKTENSIIDGFAGAYFEIKSPFVISCDTGWAITESATDFRVVGGKTVSCDDFGVYGGIGSYRNIGFTSHLFELCGSALPNKDAAAVRVDDVTLFTLNGGYLELANMCAAGKKSAIELAGCVHVNSATQFFGPGRFIFGDNTVGVKRDMGGALDVSGVQWTRTNCTAVATDTAANPQCYRIQSVSGPAANVQLQTTLNFGLAAIDPHRIKYDGAATVKHRLGARFHIKFANAQRPPAGGAWSIANKFRPDLVVRAYDATSDSFDSVADCDTRLWDFTDGDWWPVNLIFPLTWGPGRLTSTLSSVDLFITFGTDYSVTPLDAYFRMDSIVFYQSVY